MSGWPKPYPDVSKDYRTTTRAVDDLRIGPFMLPGVDVTAELQSRRALVTDAVAVEIAPFGSDRAALVVPGRVLVSNARGGGWSGWKRPAGAALRRAGYVREDLRLAGHPQLDQRLQGYARSGRTAGGRRADLEQTDVVDALGAGSQTSLEYVVALQAGVQIVVKSPGGPEPVAVTLPSPLHGPAAAQSVVVAVIDTGIAQATRPGDHLLDEVERHDGNLDLLDVFPPHGVGPHGGDGVLDLAAGHGTFAAGVVRLVDPYATIRMYRAVDSDGLGTEVAVAVAMMQAVADGAHVVNLSLGTHTVDDEPLLAVEAALDAIEVLVEQSGQEPPVFVASAGNAGSTRKVWPAASPRVTAVAALTRTAPAAWSSSGEWVDFSAVGEGVVSAFVEGVEADRLDGAAGDVFGPNAWATWSGTSFTAPQVAGAISRTCREQGCAPRQAVAWLAAQGTDLTQAGFGRAMELLPGT